MRRLMRLYGASGRRGAAIQLYRTLADALKTELGAQPEAETRAVFAETVWRGEETPPLRRPSPSHEYREPEGWAPPLPLPMPELHRKVSCNRRGLRKSCRRKRGSNRSLDCPGGLPAAIALFLL